MAPSSDLHSAVRTPGGQVFGARAARHQQPGLLRAALAAIRHGRSACVFDLDSTLLNNHQRQARIVREWAVAHGDARLAACRPAHVVSWDLRDTARLLGLTREEAEAVAASLKEHWRQRFFTSDYCQDDTPAAGTREFLEAALAAGGRILYVTGRHTGMGPGTVESFRRAGFPLPAGPHDTWPARVELWLKPDPEGDDDAWKETCHTRLRQQGGIACAFDNEPTHVNGYKAKFPDAVVLHLDTDHSGRPVPVRDDIPSILDFELGPA